jgi:hypothetical protein
MRAQLRELLAVATGDSVTMQVLSDSLGGYEGMGSAFTVLEFEDDQDPDTVFLQTVIGPRHLDKPADVTGHIRLFGELHSMALTEADSLELVERLGKRLYGM